MSTDAAFEILPAIDLRAGRVVRLRQGDFGRETAYSVDPIETALEMVEHGTRWLHVVDLDGAREGRPVQADVIAAVIAAVGSSARIEVGGGIRSAASARAYMRAGAARVVLGSMVLRSPDEAREVLAEFGPDAIAVALDVRAGRAVGSAWAPGAEGRPALTLLGGLAEAGFQNFEVTAIDRDGTLAGPDLELLQRARVQAPGVALIASGGVRSIDDVLAVRAAGCDGVIVGRAFHERTLDLGDAIRSLGP